MIVYITNSRISKRINSISWQLHRIIIIIIYLHMVGIRSKFQDIGCQPEVITTTISFSYRFFCRQVPFADVTRLIPGIFKIVCQCLRFGWKGNAISKATSCCSIHARLQTRSCWTTYRLTCERIPHMGSTLCNSVKVWHQI